MSYKINPEALYSAFMCPKLIAEKLKIANELQLKVILYALANLPEGLLVSKISDSLKISESDAEDALLFWSGCGLLLGETPKVQEKQELTKAVVAKNERPTRADVAQRGLNDKNLMFILQEAQLKFGRNLKTNEASSLVWIYDDLGLDVPLILLLLQYAKSENRLNITFLEKTASVWVEQGIDNVAAAEKYISDKLASKLAWSRVMKAFSIEQRRPSEKELQLAYMWLSEWNFSDELLIAAYEECVNQKSKFIMSYTAKILEKWHKDGVKTPADIKKKKEKLQEGASFATYDLELFERQLNSDD